ncbi:hypothetical protein EMQ_0096 [Acetobacter aceti NBRC 14818]|uniref:Transposase n=1 Tax=Acetobacter aceti NBRC 14818 TaxID=887700 RepID=A0AB33I657_ACEAC|nr:hypothetical protein EMQ_0096 [Acetobacter aceti NBRC 14818]
MHFYALILSALRKLRVGEGVLSFSECPQIITLRGYDEQDVWALAGILILQNVTKGFF